MTTPAARLPKVLCVDDEPGQLRSMRWLLRGRYEVAVASSGIDALALLGGDAFDVIISDERMPGMTGAELLECARLASPRTVRLLLTGAADIEALRRSFKGIDVYRFIPKPWDNAYLLEAVDAAARLARLPATPSSNEAPGTPPSRSILWRAATWWAGSSKNAPNG